MILLFGGSYILLMALIGLFLGVKMPTLTWTNEIMPIKQGGAVIITLLCGFVYMVLLFVGFMFMPGWKLGFCRYMSCFVGANLFLSAYFYLWLRKKVLPVFRLCDNKVIENNPNFLLTLKAHVIKLFMQELFTNEQFTGEQFLRVKIERRTTILCEEHFRIGPQVHKIDRAISKLLEARVKAEGLDEVTLMHGWILRYLYEHQEAEIYQKDIEKYFGICRSGVTNIIQALEKKGLVCRASVASDARLKKVMLTDAGRESHEKLGEIFKRMDAELEEGITEEEVQAFLRVTHKVHLNLRKMRGENS